ncbi:SH3 domain-containing protein [Pseudomonas sp. Marseille-Q8238]
MKYRVSHTHRSEYPQPITFARGAELEVGEAYIGPEGWDNWYFCTTLGQQGGWVPAQVLDRRGATAAIALEDYTARELDVDIGEIVCGSRQLDGWLWCVREDGLGSGWVPLNNLHEPAPGC